MFDGVKKEAVERHFQELAQQDISVLYSGRGVENLPDASMVAKMLKRR